MVETLSFEHRGIPGWGWHFSSDLLFFDKTIHTLTILPHAAPRRIYHKLYALLIPICTILPSLPLPLRRLRAEVLRDRIPQPIMAVSFPSHRIQEESAQIHSPHVQFKQKARAATTDKSSQVPSPITIPPSPPILVAPEPESPGISSSSAAARQPRATHSVRAARNAGSPAASPSPLALRIPEKPSKSKGSSFLNFFSVKEPSQQAFEEYERRMRAKGPTSDGRTGSGGLPGVSSAKMPAMVPKVNSNWDGVPQAIKLKEKEKKSGAPARLDKFSRSISTAGSDRSKKTVSSTNSSETSSVRFKPGFSRFDSSSGTGDLYGWESASPTNDSRDQFENADVQSDHRSASISSQLRKRMALSSHPVRTPHVPENYLDTDLPPLPSASGHASHGFPLSGKEIPLYTPAQSSSSTITSSESSPVTPYDFSPITGGSSRHLGYGTDQPHFITTTLVIPDDDELVIRSAGPQILGPPASAKRKEKKPAPSPQYKPDRFDPPDTPVQSGKSRSMGKDHVGVVSSTGKNPSLDRSTLVEIRSEPEPKTKKRNKKPLMFGK